MKNKFNDLIISELNLISNFRTNSFEVNKQHLLFQSTYYLESSNFLPAIRDFKTLIDLFESNIHLILEPPVYYLNALVGILNTLIGVKMFDEIEHFLDKVRKLESKNYSIDFLIQVRWIEYSTRMTLLLNYADFKGIEILDNEFEEKLLSKSHFFHPNMQIAFYILRAASYIYQGKIKEARKILSNTITKYKVFRKQPLFRQVSLMYLLLRAETGDISYTMQEIKSFRHRFKSEYASKIELLVLDFSKEFPLPTFKKQREEIMSQYKAKIEAVLKDKYSRKVLSYFDYTLYMESCLTGKTIETLLTR
jgi:tetratricopeptide (TPR) repeat protein